MTAEALSREAELARLIEEQRRDDTYIVRPDVASRNGVSLDATIADGEGGVASFHGLIGVTEDGEIISFLTPQRGEILNGTASYHGSIDGYTNKKCRCERCKRAHADEMQMHRKRRVAKATPDHVHGLNGYSNYGCRCDICRTARRQWFRDYRAKQRARVAA